MTPPAIGKAGILRAGIDLGYPPFGGVDRGRRAGIDIDVARAVAARLGLALQVQDVKASQAATALADGKVDVVFSAPFSSEMLSRATVAGTYLADGPVFFVVAPPGSAVATLSADTLDGKTVGAQRGSPAYWGLVAALGDEAVTPFDTLREALVALQQGGVQVAAGDALVGAYIARDLPQVRYAGDVAPAQPLGAAVAADNSRLADAVRDALDGLVGDGVVSAIRSKWVGALPRLTLPTESEDTSSPADSVLASITP